MPTTPNPIVKTTKLRAYPDWTVREYADGMLDATAGVALTPGFDTFREVVDFIREQEMEARRQRAARSVANFVNSAKR